MDKQTTSTEPRTGWIPLPRSSGASGIMVREHGKVHGGIVLLFDQAGLEDAGLQVGSRVRPSVSPDGTKISLRDGGTLKVDPAKTTDEIRRGYVARLVVPGLRLDAEGGDQVTVMLLEDGEAVLTLPAKVVLP